MKKILLLLHTIKYLKFKQIFYRLFYDLYKIKLNVKVIEYVVNNDKKL